MATHYPVTFTLEDGVYVEVNKVGDDTYDFILKPKEGAERFFSITDDVSKDKVTESLDFDQLNAVRRFWLEQEEAD
ncbi:MAG: hypothetical protein ABJA90_07315 [Ginsengibacter sp.]